MKYNVKVIGRNFKFYELNDSEGNILATIEYSAYAFPKYRVSFPNTLENIGHFTMLKHAKKYVDKVLGKLLDNN